MSNLPANDKFFDRFSFVHAAWGAVFQLSGVSAPVAIGVQIGFELVENQLKDSFSSVFPDDAPDAWQNHVGDVASFAAGYYAAQAGRGTTAGKASMIALGALAGGIWLDRMAARPAVVRGGTATGRAQIGGHSVKGGKPARHALRPLAPVKLSR